MFSSPWNANALRAYSKEVGNRGLVVGMDIFIGGTMLSKSGSQSANNVRVWFGNIRRKSSMWHEVGIAPSIYTGGCRKTDSQMREGRGVLLQRFLFLLLEDFAKASHLGLAMGSTPVFPRIISYVTDQKQERSTFGLKGAGGFADCTPCFMPFRVRLPRKPQRDEIEEPLDFTGLCVEEAEQAAVRLKAVMKDDVFLRQTTRETANRRDVTQTLSSQIIVSRAKQSPPKSEEGKTERMNAIAFLDNTSYNHLPSALAAVAGLGSAPHRLFDSVAFDILHACNLGILRQLPDDAVAVFETLEAYIGVPKATAVRIANQRMLDVPKSARIGRNTPFRTSSSEKQAGMSGMLRKKIGAFLWCCVMGIPRETSPDNDQLLQAMLCGD